MQETPLKMPKAVAGPVGEQLQVSRYDRASSLLLALLLTAGTVAFFLFVIWLSNKVSTPPRSPDLPPILHLGNGEGGGNRQAPGGSQLDTPSDELVVGKDDRTTNIQEELRRLDVTSLSKADFLDDPDALLPERRGSQGTGGGIGGGDGPGKGLGDQRDRRVGDPAAPERKWEVLFSKSALDAYTKQLDFFKIELGALLPGNKIVYAYHLGKSKPDTRTATDPAGEKRYYLTWRSGEMQQADRDLLARAGVEAGNSLVVKFLPPEVEQQLIDLEKSYAGVNAKRIQRTRFGVRAEGAGFAFYVMEQSLRRN